MRKRLKLNRSSQSSKKEEHSKLLLLPRAIIFDILVRLPAEFLHECGRFVCKAWEEIIQDPDFISENLHASKPALLFRVWAKSPYIYYSTADLERGKVTARPLKLDSSFIVLSTCDGVCLLEQGRKLYVANILIEKSVRLTRPLGCRFYGHQVVRIPRTGEIKVCCYCNDREGTWSWIVFDVGRKVCRRRIGISSHFVCSVLEGALSVEGIVYWYFKDQKILALDPCQGTTQSISLPHGDVVGSFKFKEKLSVLLKAGDDLRLYILQDLQSGKWNNAYNIILGFDSKIPEHYDINTLACLDDQTLLLGMRLEEGYALAIYNMKTSGTKMLFEERFFVGNSTSCFNGYLSYTKSLVSW